MNFLERTLIIETSGRSGVVASGRTDRILGVRLLSEARRHARDLAAHVAQLLNDQNWQARDLTAVIVGTGPGSYTGLRVGIASAKALAYATGCELFGVPAFDAVAAGFEEDGEALEIIADAQQGNVYAQSFGRDVRGAWRPAHAVQVLAFADWAAALAPSAWVAGPAAPSHRERLPARVRVATGHVGPEPLAMLRLVGARPQDYRANCWQIEPIYARGSSAEEKRQRASGAGAGRRVAG